MHRRKTLVAALAVSLLAGCSSDEESPKDSRKSVRSAVESYVKALNSRDADRLIEVGGVPDDSRSRREAGQILAKKGGRGLSVTDIQVDLDMGPSAALAKLAAREKSGKDVKDTFRVVKEDGSWNVVVFLDRPAPADKPTASTE